MARAKKETALTPEERLQAALVPDWEWPYKLPENWCWTRHNSIMDIVGGAQPEKAFFIREPKEGYVQLYQTRDYGENPVPVYIPQKYATKATDEGDILLARYGGSLGKVFRAHKGAYNVALAKVIILYPEVVDDEFLYLYYYSHFYQDFCVKAGYGRSAQAGFNKSDLNELLFPLPPFIEQQRIVDRIESLFSKLDEAKEKAQAVVDSFEDRKAAILHKAFTGELTKKWRKCNGIKRENWRIVTLGELIVNGPQNGLYKSQAAYGNGVRILRIDSFYDGYVEPWNSLKKLTLNDDEIALYRLNVGDIIINRVNSMPYLGKSALIRDLPEACVFESNMMRLSLDRDKSMPEYIIRYLNSADGLVELRKNAKQAVNQASINQQDVKNVIIRLPSKDEQIEIVDILGRLIDKEKQSQAAAEAVLAQIDLMKKSILARAFRGELGTNDPTEESAVELLKKIIQ